MNELLGNQQSEYSTIHTDVGDKWLYQTYFLY